MPRANQCPAINHPGAMGWRHEESAKMVGWLWWNKSQWFSVGSLVLAGHLTIRGAARHCHKADGHRQLICICSKKAVEIGRYSCGITPFRTVWERVGAAPTGLIGATGLRMEV